MNNVSNHLGKIIKQRRVIIPLTLDKLAATTGASPSHLCRIERGERFPSARVLRKVAKPLGFSESELFTLADYLSPQSSSLVESEVQLGKLDPNVARALSKEPAEVQRSMLAILFALKCMAKGIARENPGSRTGGTIGANLYKSRVNIDESLCQPGREKGYKWPVCELLTTCPFLNDRMQYMSEMTETDKEQYCQGDYAWCGRYLVFKALEKELKRTSSFGLVLQAAGQNK